MSKSDSKNYMGLDPSLTGFGICVYSPTQGTEPWTDVYKSEAAKGLELRMARYHRLLVPVLTVVEETAPKLIAIEGYAYAARGQGIRDVAEMGGILRRRLLATGIPVIEVSPSSLKQFITGKGGGKGTDKTAMVMAIYKRYGVDFSDKTSDEADAFALARFAAVYDGADKPQTKEQAAAVEKVKNPKPRTKGKR